MKLHEALSKSNKVRRSCWMKDVYFDYIRGKNVAFHTKSILEVLVSSDYQADDWEPILEKKKMYQALLRYENGSYYITPFLYPDEAIPKEVYNNFFVKLLTDRPIEVEDV